MSFTRCSCLFLLAALPGMGQSGGSLTIVGPNAVLPPAIVNQPYSQSFTATGGTLPYGWSISGDPLPSGLIFSSSGTITGIPQTTGTSDLLVKVTDGNGTSVSQRFSITVIAGGILTRFGTMAHIAAGGWWDSKITVLNPSSVPIAITVGFRADDGSPLPLALQWTQQGSTKSANASSVTLALNPTSMVVIAAGALTDVVTGWAEVLSTGPVAGFAILRSTPTNDKPSEATVPIQTNSPSSLTLPYDNTAGYVMGVALVNMAVGPATISATIWDENGAQIGVQQIPVSANGHTAFVLTDPSALPVTAGKRGIIQFKNLSGGVSILGLRFSPAGPFTNVPVLP